MQKTFFTWLFSFLLVGSFGFFAFPDIAWGITCSEAGGTCNNTCSNGTFSATGCGTDSCCKPDPATPQNGPGSNTPITFDNPLGDINSVEALVGKILIALRGFIGVLAVLFIVIGAFFYLTSAGDSGRIETGKKAITAAMIGLAIVLAAPSFILEIYTILGGAPSGEVAGATSLAVIITKVLTFLLGIFGVLAVIMLVVGGMMYLLAAGDENRIDTGKDIVKYSIIGIIITLSAMLIVKQIGNIISGG